MRTFSLFPLLFLVLQINAQTPDATPVPREMKGLYCPTSSGLAKAWLQKGQEAFMDTDLAAAIVFFKKSVAADSGFCDPHHVLSIIYTNLGKLDSAEYFSRRAFALNPMDKLKFNFATTLGLRGKYDEAIPLLEQLLATDYQKPIVHQSLAQMYLFKERFDDAIVQANASLALCELTDPQTAATDYLIIGSAWLWQQKPEKARPMLRRAIELGAHVPDSYRQAAGL